MTSHEGDSGSEQGAPSDRDWSDWSGSEDEEPAQSLFEETVLESAASAIAYDGSAHGLDLVAVRHQVRATRHAWAPILFALWLKRRYPANLECAVRIGRLRHDQARQLHTAGGG